MGRRMSGSRHVRR